MPSARLGTDTLILYLIHLAQLEFEPTAFCLGIESALLPVWPSCIVELVTRAEVINVHWECFCNYATLNTCRDTDRCTEAPTLYCVVVVVCVRCVWGDRG